MDPIESRKPAAQGSDDSPATTPRDRCDFCGVETTLQGGFRRTHRSFDRKVYRACPRCYVNEVKREAGRARRLGTYSWILIACGALSALVFPGNRFCGVWLLNFTFIYGCMFASIIPHEFGHALAARWLGLRVFRMLLGEGKTWLRLRILEIDVEVKAIPTSGLVVAAHRETGGYRWKQFLFVLAGPAANGVLLVVAFVVMRSQTSDLSNLRWSINDGFEGWLDLFYANGFILLVNFWPRTMRTAVGEIPSDGRCLFRALFANHETARANHALRFLFEARASSEARRAAESFQWLERGLALYPTNYNLLEFMALQRLKSGENSAAREIFVGLLKQATLPTPMRAILLNNIAYADALLGGDELLSEADRYSAEALAALSWLRCVINTRGTVLLFSGRIDEALPLLRSGAEDPKVDATAAAECQCQLAIAEAWTGNPAAAARHRDQAHLADPECNLLSRADAALSGKEPRPETRTPTVQNP